jgi:hypothetical protein
LQEWVFLFSFVEQNNNTMKFQTHNQTQVSTGGTSYVGEIKADYKDLKRIFGRPLGESGDGKTDAEWEIAFEDGEVATIYNWKDGKNYNGASGIAKTKITNWHVGGHSKGVVSRIQYILTNN